MSIENYKLFKWIGGKSWISNKLNEKTNEIIKDKNIITYVEPFCGGLGSFLSIFETLKNNGIKEVILNDLNSNLIFLYEQIKLNPNGLFETYEKIENEFKNLIPTEAKFLHKTKDKVELKVLLKEANDFYLEKRKILNQLISENESQSVLERSAIFLFILKHNFNGIYRENSKGEINSPFNWEALNINLISFKKSILNLSELFNSFNIKFCNLDIDDFFNTVYIDHDKTFFYYDPPYINEVQNTENSYTSGGFSNEKQINLINFINKNNKYFLYSNHLNNLILENFKNYNYEIIQRKNLISPNKENRGKTISEVLIFNK